MAKEAIKGQQKLQRLLKKGLQNFEVTKKGQNIFSKADTINLPQFLVHRVRRNPVQTCRSNAPSSAHQRGRASGVVDGNFPYWV